MRPDEIPTHDGASNSILLLLFYATAAVLILIGRWALKQIQRGIRVRAEAVSEWQDCDKQERDVWDGLPVAAAVDRCDAVDGHLADQPDEVLLTHEATPEIDEHGTPDQWLALEDEFADLNGLAEQLGERAQ